MPVFSYHHRQLFYRETGAGPLLLVLPGATATSAVHEGELEHFGKRFHTVSLDFWGTGQSGRVSPWPLDWWEQAASDVSALVTWLGEDNAWIMGTSGGGIVALLTGILYPQVTHGIIADSTDEFLSPAQMKILMAGRDITNTDSMQFWQHNHGEDWADVVREDSAYLLQRSSLTQGDWFKGRLKEIHCPTLLTASLKDDMIPEVGPQVLHMAEQIQGCQVFFNQDGNHPLMWSRPQVFRRMADAFLSG